MGKGTNYLVVEVHNAYAVILDNSGRFIKTANCGYEVGDVVDNIIPLIYPQDKKKRKKNIIRLATSMAACICLCVFGIYEYQNMYTEYGSIHIQINPKVEITLSHSGRVLNIEGENTDGKELVKDYEYKGKDKETVVNELADMAIEQQYLADNGRISIEVNAQSDEWEKKIETELSEELNDYLQKQGMVIEITIGPVEVEDDAEDKDILKESQSVTIPIPKSSDKTDDSVAESSDYSDDQVTDYSVPSNRSSLPSSSSLPFSGSYETNGSSPYDSNSNSSYNDSSYSSSDYNDDDNQDDDD